MSLCCVVLCCVLYCVESRIFLYTAAAIDGVLFYCGGRGFGMLELTQVSKSGGSWGYTTFYFFFFFGLNLVLFLFVWGL